jgi:hypothetical protein
MDEEMMQEWLQDLLDQSDDPEWSTFNVAPEKVRTFEDVGVLTKNKGLVVTMTDGSKFHLTIMKE